MSNFKIKSIPFASLALAPVGFAQACPGGGFGYQDGNQGWWGMPMMGWGGGWGLGIFGGIISLLFWIALIIAIIYFTKHFMRDDRGSREDDATEILKKRYAKGEITKEDYDRMKKELEKM